MKALSVILLACLGVSHSSTTSRASGADLEKELSPLQSMNQQSDWVRITCLLERDSFSASEGKVETKFLVESLRDTFQIDQIYSDCGCEVGQWKWDCLIFPGKPDTIKIHSDISFRRGGGP